MTLTNSNTAKHNKVFSPASSACCTAALLAVFLTVCMGILANAAMAQDRLNLKPVSLLKSCNAGFAETWIVGQSCFVGRSIAVKTNDAIHISCAGNDVYSIALFVEPAGSDPATSNAVAHEICPGNGRITRNADGDQVLRCNFWESVENVAKQLEVKLQSSVSGTNIRSMSWKVSELDNPNVVCGVSGRPNDDSDTVGSGHTS